MNRQQEKRFKYALPRKKDFHSRITNILISLLVFDNSGFYVRAPIVYIPTPSARTWIRHGNKLGVCQKSQRFIYVADGDDFIVHDGMDSKRLPKSIRLDCSRGKSELG